MKAEEILNSFLKYANYGGGVPMTQAPSPQPNLVQAPKVTGQPSIQTLNIASDNTGQTNGNSVSKSVKPATNTSKGLTC
jgi:hypothetical protein